MLGEFYHFVKHAFDSFDGVAIRLRGDSGCLAHSLMDGEHIVYIRPSGSVKFFLGHKSSLLFEFFPQ